MFCYTHMFNKDNWHWTKGQKFNMAFLECQRNYIADKFKHRGYMYMNEIYETLGLEWHPEYCNPVFTKDGHAKFSIEFVPIEGTSDVRIEIHC